MNRQKGYAESVEARIWKTSLFREGSMKIAFHFWTLYPNESKDKTPPTPSRGDQALKPPLEGGGVQIINK
jgi:hypothetical protein